MHEHEHIFNVDFIWCIYQYAVSIFFFGLGNKFQFFQRSKEVLDTHGAGLSSVRFICGTQDIHKELERKISVFHEREGTILSRGRIRAIS